MILNILPQRNKKASRKDWEAFKILETWRNWKALLLNGRDFSFSCLPEKVIDQVKFSKTTPQGGNADELR